MMHPAIEAQQQFWDAWNSTYRGEVKADAFMQAQGEAAQRYCGPGPTLDVGCGTGWLCQYLARRERSIMGVDFSEEAITRARQRYPNHTFQAGDFLTMIFSQTFANVVSADCLAHVPDQRAFVDRIASLLVPHGTFVLMTQNPFVWTRMSSLMPQGAGQIRHWPTIKEIRQLLARDFTIEHCTALCAGGDQGILRIVNSRLLRGGLRLLLGKTLRDRLYEHWVGRELVIVARRR